MVQLEIPFEVAMPLASVKSQVVKEIKNEYSREDMIEWQNLELSYFRGRAAYICERIEREMRKEEEVAKAFLACAAMRERIYK